MKEPVMLAPVKVHDLRKGDVIYTRKYHDYDGEKGRPAVVLAVASGSAIVAYMTAGKTEPSVLHIPAKVKNKPSTILLHRMASISLDRVMERAGRVSPDEMNQIDQGLAALYHLPERSRNANEQNRKTE